MDLGFKRLFGNGSPSPEISGELRTTLLRMRHERTAFETLVTRMNETVRNAETFSEPVEEARKSVEELRAQVLALQTAMSTVTGIEERLADMEARLRGVSVTTDGLYDALTHAEADVGQTVTEVRAAKAVVPRKVARILSA